MEQSASDRDIINAFRQISREKHPDRNRGDEERATRDFQDLTQAKIVLLDPEKRKKHDKELVDGDVRNRNAFPLLCSICANEKVKGTHGKFALRCLKGFGHKNPLIEEYHAATQEYHHWKKNESNLNFDKKKYIRDLQTVFKNFVASDFLKMYPLANTRKRKSCSEEGVFPITMPDFVNKLLKDSSSLGENQTNGIKVKKSFATETPDVVKLFDASLTRESEMTIEEHTSSFFYLGSSPLEFPMYDLSSLSKSELEQLYHYFGLSYDRFASRKNLAKNLRSFIPTIEMKQEFNHQEKVSTKVCQRCNANNIFWFTARYIACYICSKICCQNCLSQSKRKVPASGSLNLMPVCRECLTNAKSKEAENWLKLGQRLLATSETSRDLETVLAMFRISYELGPSDVALISQAQAMFTSKEHARLVDYCKELLSTNKLRRANELIIQHWIAESLLQIAHDTDDSDLLAKTDKYEETVNWIESVRDDGDGEATIHETKVTAMKGRLDCIRKCEQITSKITGKLFSRLLGAIRQGSLIEMVAILEYEDEEVVKVCLEKLEKEPRESYTRNSKLLLGLGQAAGKLMHNDPTTAINQVADVFWNGYAVFQANESNMNITDYVVYFTCLLLKRKRNLPLESLGGITVHNLLQCLQLNEVDLLTPPDIDNRKWENLDVPGSNMKMFSKYELAVKKLVQTNKWSPVDAALSYYDLIRACKNPSQILIVLITSAQWFSKQMACSNSDKALQYRCRKMTMKLTNLVAALAFEYGIHPLSTILCGQNGSRTPILRLH